MPSVSSLEELVRPCRTLIRPQSTSRLHMQRTVCPLARHRWPSSPRADDRLDQPTASRALIGDRRSPGLGSLSPFPKAIRRSLIVKGEKKKADDA